MRTDFRSFFSESIVSFTSDTEYVLSLSTTESSGCDAVILSFLFELPVLAEQLIVVVNAAKDIASPIITTINGFLVVFISFRILRQRLVAVFTIYTIASES